MGVPAPASTPKKRKKEERAGLEGFLASEDEFTSGASEDDFSESEGADLESESESSDDEFEGEEEENLVKEAEELAATTKRKTQKSKEPHKLRPRKKDVQYMFEFDETDELSAVDGERGGIQPPAKKRSKRPAATAYEEAPLEEDEEVKPDLKRHCNHAMNRSHATSEMPNPQQQRKTMPHRKAETPKTAPGKKAASKYVDPRMIGV